jgi:hypothetical protein
MNDTATRPVTYRQTTAVPVGEALMRYQLLARRDQLSKTAASSRPPGRRRPGGAASEPLTILERLELLALGEHLACHFRHPALVHYAVQAGATWPQIAAALDQLSLHARQDYADWADRQRALAECSPGMTTGFSEAEHIKALAAAACPSCPQCGSGEVVWDGNDESSESWNCLACDRDYVTGGQG